MRGNATLAGLAAVLLLAAPATAAPTERGAATKVGLELTGGSGTRAGTSCGLRKSWRYYRVDGRVSFRGTTMRAGKVTVTVKRCFGKSFSTVKTLTVTAKANGSFAGSFLVTTASDCYVQARSGNVSSARRYFRVR